MNRSLGVFALATVCIGGCASVPAPTEQVAVSSAAVSDAESAGSGQYAPAVLHTAQQRLHEARRAMAAGENERARRLAEEAEVDARLAAADARSTKAQKAAQEVSAGIDALRSETERSGSPAVIEPFASPPSIVERPAPPIIIDHSTPPRRDSASPPIDSTAPPIDSTAPPIDSTPPAMDSTSRPVPK
jgi:hypothetical protein